jgi:hypothetical protein
MTPMPYTLRLMPFGLFPSLPGNANLEGRHKT